MERDAQALMRELGLTNQDIVFFGDIDVRTTPEIGRGSDASVYRVNWQGIDIALKVLHPILIEPGNQDRERKIRSFGQEIFRLSRIHHPNLCQLLGIARVGQNAALALELLTSTLQELSVGEGREDGLKLIGYLCDTSAGIRYLHVCGILHRDLAPKNVMIKNGVAKVCDFGMAKFLRWEFPHHQQQQAARMDMTRCPGTLVFMSPEALVEQPDYDRPLDIFSFGVTLLAVITGVMPGIDLINAPSVVIVRDAASGRETTQVVAETRRRAAYLRRLSDDHPLKPMAIRCHSNEPSERPTAEDVHEEMKRVLQLFAGLSSPHLPNVPPAVVRRLDSISEQLTQQATSITSLATRSDALEEQLAAVITQNQTTAQQLPAIQQEVSSIRNEQTTTNNQIESLAEQLRDTNHRLAQQTAALSSQHTETSDQISALNDNVLSISGQLSRLSSPPRQVSTSRPLAAQEELSNDAPPMECFSPPLAGVSTSRPLAAQGELSNAPPPMACFSPPLAGVSTSRPLAAQGELSNAPPPMACFSPPLAGVSTSRPLAAQGELSNAPPPMACFSPPLAGVSTSRPLAAQGELSNAAPPMGCFSPPLAGVSTSRPLAAQGELSNAAPPMGCFSPPLAGVSTSRPLAAQGELSNAAPPMGCFSPPLAGVSTSRPLAAQGELSNAAPPMACFSPPLAGVPTSRPLAAQGELSNADPPMGCSSAPRMVAYFPPATSRHVDVRDGWRFPVTHPVTVPAPTMRPATSRHAAAVHEEWVGDPVTPTVRAPALATRLATSRHAAAVHEELAGDPVTPPTYCKVNDHVAANQNTYPDQTVEMVTTAAYATSTGYGERRIVDIKRGDSGYGFNIVGGNKVGMPVYVSRILPGGVAARQGQLKKGDQILSINGQAIRGMSHEDMVRTMTHSQSSLRIVVSYAPHLLDRILKTLETQ
ncbi:probable serine/threonine-protein kinase roco5 [Sycon ciliatum]|uniref:probable serine/threonine-protein kinase roco5 n=1 Tax=Sycon ciliatum TaxID=27933 RepID=UPI0031F7161B